MAEQEEVAKLESGATPSTILLQARRTPADTSMTSGTGSMGVDGEEKDLVTFDQSALFLTRLQSFVQLANALLQGSSSTAPALGIEEVYTQLCNIVSAPPDPTDSTAADSPSNSWTCTKSSRICWTRSWSR